MKKNNLLCISSYYKGYEFLEEAHNLGNHVILITSESLKQKNWPWHAIDEVYYMPEIEPYQWNMDHMIEGIQYLLKDKIITKVIALDDFDVEKAALVRETFRISGMGQTTHRYFRDKLAMRQQAKDHKILCPSFTPIFNDEILREFIAENPAPWVLKPRSEASATGIKKITDDPQLWEVIDSLGKNRFQFLLESFKPGQVFHVDSLIFDKKVIFTSCSAYLQTPMEVSHGGGVFRTQTIDEKSKDFKDLESRNEKVIKKFGLHYGATHTEFIKSEEDGKFYFLETSARVGGAHIPDMVEAATGINIWREWAQLETALLNGKKYSLPKVKNGYGGLIISLIKEKNANFAPFENKHLWKKIPMEYHIGLVYQAKSRNKITELLEEGTHIIQNEFLNILPPSDKPTN